MNVPTSIATARIEVRRSKFYSFAEPLSDPEMVRSRVESKRAEFPGCSHVVWAFVFGTDGERFGSNDDHEPKGSAGRPALEVVKGSGLTNVLVLIVRFFGGTKLGIGGLSRAYAEAVKQVLSVVDSEPLVIRVRFSMRLDYPFYDAYRRLADEYCVTDVDTQFDTAVHISGLIAADRAVSFGDEVGDLTNGGTKVDFEEY